MIATLLCSMQLQAGDVMPQAFTSVMNGSAHYGKETIDQIVINGKAELDGTTVTTRLQVSGTLDAKDAHIKAMDIHGKTSLNGCVVDTMEIHGKTSLDRCSIGSMEVYGKADLSDCSISKKSTITGFLVAGSSKFLEELTVASDRIVFSSCSLSSLRVIETKGFKNTQVVELKDNTTVNGSIIFERGNGEVILGSNCTITGNIVGGKLRKSA